MNRSCVAVATPPRDGAERQACIIGASRTPGVRHPCSWRARRALRLSGEDARGLRPAPCGSARRWQPRVHSPAIPDGKPRFDVWNSPLAEYSVFGLRLTAALESPETLTIWEAQFGDFANGAQTVIDSSSTQQTKMGPAFLAGHAPCLTATRPGPDHSAHASSATCSWPLRTTCGSSQPSTPAKITSTCCTAGLQGAAQAAHRVHAQAAAAAVCRGLIDEFTSGFGFQPVIGDTTIAAVGGHPRPAVHGSPVLTSPGGAHRGDTSIRYPPGAALPLPGAEVARPWPSTECDGDVGAGRAT